MTSIPANSPIKRLATIVSGVVALTLPVLYAPAAQASGSVIAANPAYADTAPHVSRAAIGPVPDLRVSIAKRLGPGKKRYFQVVGAGAVPAVRSVEATIVVESRGRGPVTVWPTGMPKAEKTRLTIGTSHRARKTFSQAPGLGGQWTVLNGTRRNISISLVVRGYMPAGAGAGTCGLVANAPSWEHVVVIVLENRSLKNVIGSANAPYMNAVAASCGLATNMHAITYPSLPNYISLTSGSTQGVTNNGLPSRYRLNVPSIFSQLGPGRWRTLAESMPGRCVKHRSGTYVPKHNPALYYTNIASQCANQVVPLRATPNLSAPLTLVIPNQRHNTHDSTVRTGDQWLSRFLPKVLNTPQYTAGKTAVFVTFDEDDGSSGNRIATMVLSPSTGFGARSGVAYTHYSLLRTLEEMLGLPLLGGATYANSLRPAFNLG